MPAANGRIGNNRSIHHALEDKKDDGDIRNEQGQFSGPIVLVKKDVDEIVFLRFFTEENDIIKNIVKLGIKNHFPNEGHIQDDAVNHTEQDTNQVAVLTPEADKRPGRVTSTSETTKT